MEAVFPMTSLTAQLTRLSQQEAAPIKRFTMYRLEDVFDDPS